MSRLPTSLSTPDDGLTSIIDDDQIKSARSSVQIATTPGPLAIPMIVREERAAQTAQGTQGAKTGDEAAGVGRAASGENVSTAASVQRPGSSKNLVSQHNGVHLRENPYEFFSQLGAWAQGTGWRSYNEYIGTRVFYEGYSDETIRRIMRSPAVTGRIRALAEQRYKQLGLPEDAKKKRKLGELEGQLQEVAHAMATKMVARMDSLQYLRGFGAVINNILIRMYHQGIHISVQEFIEFRKVALYAAERKISLFILPCHKSHIDYLTISWLFFRLGLALPHIVAGENLDLPLVGAALQNCGAFFIRRSFGDDAMYPVVIKEYIEQLLENGHNLECFIEGTRSRTGKVLPPKLGILKYVLEAVMAGRTNDVMICPISVQYDKVIETESYVNELLGNPKEKESLWGLITNTRILQLKMGRVDVRFQKPYSLKAFIQEQQDRRRVIRRTDGSEQPFDLEDGHHKVLLLRALGYRVLSDINAVSVIMPAALVGTVILTLRGRGVGKTELVRRVDWLRGAIESRGGRVAEFGGMTTDEVVSRALEVMRDLVGEHPDLVEPTFYALKRFELSFYRNQVIHMFVSEAMLSAALYTRVKQGGAAPAQRMPREELLSELGFLSQLLKQEFVYGTEGLVANSEKVINGLERERILLVEDDLVGLAPRERQIGRENFDFYCFLIWPFIETYWLAAVSLFALTPSATDLEKSGKGGVAWYNEKDFYKRAQHFGKTLFYQGDVSYLEAVNQATLVNAFQRLGELGVVLNRRSKSAGAVALMAVHPRWTPTRNAEGRISAEGNLWSFLERLGSFRREGKNRRDNSTVSTRVMTYADTIAPPIVEWVAFDRTHIVAQEGDDIAIPAKV